MVQRSKNTIHYYAGTDRYIERMFGTHLRYLHCLSTIWQQNIVNTIDFITKNICRFLWYNKVIEHDAILHLFHSKNRITGIFKTFASLNCCLEITPLHTVIGPKCSFVNLTMRRTCRYTAKKKRLYPKGIGSSENEPTLLSERILSRTITIGNFSTFLYSSTSILFNSDIVNLRIIFLFGAKIIFYFISKKISLHYLYLKIEQMW